MEKWSGYMLDKQVISSCVHLILDVRNGYLARQFTDRNDIRYYDPFFLITVCNPFDADTSFLKLISLRKFGSLANDSIFAAAEYLI